MDMTGLSLFEPMRDTVTLREALNRLFEDSFVPAGAPAGARSMPLDIVETADAFVVKASLPGTERDKIGIHFQNDQLTLKATLNESKLEEGHKWVLRERFVGDVTRSVTFPVSVDPDKASANYKDGILTLTLPKAESVKPRTIKVSEK